MIEPVKLSSLNIRHSYAPYVQAALSMGPDEALPLDITGAPRAAYGKLRYAIGKHPLKVQIIQGKPYLVRTN